GSSRSAAVLKHSGGPSRHGCRLVPLASVYQAGMRVAGSTGPRLARAALAARSPARPRRPRVRAPTSSRAVAHLRPLVVEVVAAVIAVAPRIHESGLTFEGAPVENLRAWSYDSGPW